MPLSVAVDSSRGLISATATGIVTEDEIQAYVAEFLHRRGLGHLDELFDLTQADLEDLTPAALVNIAQAAAAADPEAVPTKIAFLVSEATGITITRMYQVHREDRGGYRQSRIFQDRTLCLEWLDLPPDWVPEEV